MHGLGLSIFMETTPMDVINLGFAANEWSGCGTSGDRLITRALPLDCGVVACCPL